MSEEERKCIALHEEVLRFIAKFRGSEDVFLNGCCYWFARILWERFGDYDAVIAYEPCEGHFVTIINGRAYDIRGDVAHLYWGKTLYAFDALEGLDSALYERLMRDCRNFGEVEADAKEAYEVLKAQEPRVMNVAEVTALEAGTVLWVEEHQGVTWNLFPLEIDVSSIHPDTGTNYLFFITYHGCKKFECEEYNRTWRCWTERPTDEQRKATPWP